MKHLILDFDGVINVYQHNELLEEPTHWDTWEETKFAQYPICYSPELIQWVNNKVEDPEWKVYWLSSWCKKTHWFSTIGLSDKITAIQPLNYINPRKGYVWKKPAGLDLINRILSEHPEDTIVWVDDEPAVNWMENTPPQVQTITTDEHAGLDKTLCGIIDIL